MCLVLTVALGMLRELLRVEVKLACTVHIQAHTPPKVPSDIDAIWTMKSKWLNADRQYRLRCLVQHRVPFMQKACIGAWLSLSTNGIQAQNLDQD